MHQTAPKRVSKGSSSLKKQRPSSDFDLLAEALQFTPVPTLILSRDLQVLGGTLSFFEEFGYSTAELTGRFLIDFIHPSDRKTIGVLLRKKPLQARKRKGIDPTAEGRFLHHSQIWRHVRLSVRTMAHPIDADSDIRILALEDITERKQAEQTWRMMSAVFENALQGMARYDCQGNHIHVNDAYARLFGYTPAEMIGINWESVVHPDDRDRLIDAYIQMMSEGRAVIESRAIRKDGSVFHRENVMIVARDADEKFAGHHSFSRDITERIEGEKLVRHSRQQLRDLSIRLQRVREEEQTRIAREIHDNLGQNLTGLKMDLASFATSFIALTPAKERKRLQQRGQDIGKLIDEIIDTVRQIAAELRPGVLDHLGIGPAIEWQAEEFARRSGLVVAVKNRVEGVVGMREGTVVFRIFQELMTNIVRHAKATRVEIEIANPNGKVVLIVRDDGRGITKEEINASHALGILGMQERVVDCNGSLHLKGTPGAGTMAILTIPFEIVEPITVTAPDDFLDNSEQPLPSAS
ncbi:PAS domain S-box-containing protein [Verrucomicrobium sp. GAS474]|uniref:PAS domain-containing sensor histidine kinase n=1 Tax=Verrucomicrobium sp. GAS474 TaxID=1882831 RepID=UPI0008792A2D|nr:PAS domain S-box protein [Verrucomicrobium sp. GAS474]SDU19739.1 PAS domain S-box-containing protein [Verrucomicrobium sp. GAS474]